MQVNMSANSSSDSSFHPPICTAPTYRYVFTAYNIGYILLLPLFIFVLYVGYQQWKKQRSVATAVMTSHSDIITFNMVVLELMGVTGSLINCCGIYIHHQITQDTGVSISSATAPGQTLFHLLTCVERYLAVVHPVTYRGLRQSGGVRIRNISIACVWLLCFGLASVSKLNFQLYFISTFLILAVSSVVVSFCSLGVVCILIRPGPGEMGANRERVDPTKQRAFHTIMMITVALLVRLLSSLVANAVYSSQPTSSNSCLTMAIAMLFFLPSSLVLPLLFLHRAGKLRGCKHKLESS